MHCDNAFRKCDALFKNFQSALKGLIPPTLKNIFKEGYSGLSQCIFNIFKVSFDGTRTLENMYPLNIQSFDLN